ncbi:33467_t:CDS:10 [Gigaspora margarita]|uniref:Mannosyltransferase n=1 Tax=Gigaspora margarita TaxID=4874 RepID=A0ABM8W5I4_GIGMA|nr:33467_t:CDS:10 [Gigaspora margarita]
MTYDWKNVMIYIFLCFLRLICALSPGYIHPDEFFQSPEIMGGDVFGFEVFRPWEFEQYPQCRSIVIPALTIGLPFKLLKIWNNLRIGMGLTGTLIVLTKDNFKLAMSTEKFQELIPLAFGIVFISAICVIIDSLYFGTLKLIDNGVVLTKHHIFEFLSNPITLLKVEWQGNLIFTPLNNILYNLDSNNLSEHGLHPRYLHIYNFTLLFGPLVLLTMKDLNVSFNYMRFTAKKRYKTVSVVIVPSDRLQKLPKLFWLAWVIFNAIFTVFFGGYHQAGIIPIIQRLQYQTIGFRNCEEYEGTVRCDIGRKIIRPVVKNSSSETFITNIIFYKTYMPPRHLFCYPEAWRDTNIQVNIHDLAGRPIRILETLLLKQVNPRRQLITPNLMRHIHFQRRVDGNVTLRQYERTLLVTPSTTDLSIFEEHNELHSNSETKKIELVLIDKYWPHLNFDYLDRVFKHGIYLNVYAVTQR